MTRRTGELMFRIGGEEDLLDPIHASTSSAPEPPAAADISGQSAPVTPSAVGVLDAPASVSPARPDECAHPSPTATAPDAATTSSCGLDPRDPVAALLLDPRASGGDSERIAGRICRDGVTASGSLRGARWPQVDEDRGGSGLGRSISPSTRLRRSGLTRLHIWIAWVNAVILAVLIVAAVVGHDPSSTTGASRGPSTAQAPARLADSGPAGPATSNSSPKPDSKRRRPTYPAQPPSTP